MPVTHPPRLPLVAPVVGPAGANVTLTGTGLGTWIDADASGNASARNMDVLFLNCRVGQQVWVVPSMLVSPGAAPTTFDMFTYVDGVPVHQFGASTGGRLGWFATASVNLPMGAPADYIIQSGDLENVVNGVGTLRCRLRFSRAVGNATITGTAGYEWKLAGLGPFG